MLRGGETETKEAFFKEEKTSEGEDHVVLSEGMKKVLSKARPQQAFCV